MGYPMTWERLVGRNMLSGDYNGTSDVRPIIAGDMRRLEMDSRDGLHLQLYAKQAGVTEAQVLVILNAFFGERHPFRPGADWDNNYGTTGKQHTTVKP